MKKYFVSGFLLVALMIGFAFTGVANAADDECPVGYIDGSTTWDEEFGPGTTELTNCILNRGKVTKVKILVQINKFCRDTWNSAGERVLDITDCDPGRAYGLHNIENMLRDYEKTYEMYPGSEIKVIALVHGEGNHIVLKDGYRFNDTVKGEVVIENPYQGDVEALMAKGVRFMFCQNAARNFMSHGDLPSYLEGEGSATDALIPGVEYHTAGMTAMADLQARGYSYIKP